MVNNLKIYKGVLIVVDMVNGFVREGVLHDSNISKVVPRQIELIKENLANNNLVIFIKDTHNKDAREFKRFGNTKHCAKGTRECELIDELKGFENNKNTISIEKNSTSFMEAPEFIKIIKELVNVKKVDIIGCCTDICVFNGSMGLANYFDEHNIDADVFVHTDAIATYSEKERKKYIDAAMLLMEQQGIKLVKKR